MSKRPIHPEHITNIIRVFGPLLAGVEGKTTKRVSLRAHTEEADIPDNF